MYRAPVPLGPEHEVGDFLCRSGEQTEWLRRFARQSAAEGSTRVLVVTEAARADVVAYYAWRMAEVDIENAPLRLRKGAGRYRQPVALLARLGVDERHEGRGLGAALLVDVISRAAEVSTRIGCRALLAHCETDAARAFYNHLIPEFEASPTDPLHLFLLLKDIRRTLRNA